MGAVRAGEQPLGSGSENGRVPVKAKKPAICGICPEGCWIEAELEDGRLVGVDRVAHRFGVLCTRAMAAPEIVYSPDRILKPLIRKEPKGSFSFEETTWDNAMETITAKLQEIKERHGAHTVASYVGRGAFETGFVETYAVLAGQRGAGANFLAPFGSPNAGGVGSLCFYSYGIFGSIPTFGVPARLLAPDVERAELILVWGGNPPTDSPTWLASRLFKAKKKGARLVVIDHMRSVSAQRADEWIPIRSGTDGALALGMLRVIIEEELYDRDFVDHWTIGFAELKEYVGRFTPEEVERITWIPAETVVRLAREIAAAKGTALRMYTGLEYSDSGVQNIRAVFTLMALTGNLDAPGGLLINTSPKSTLNKPKVPLNTEYKPIGADEYPLFYAMTGAAQFVEARKAILEEKPYPIKALIIIGSSVLTSYPDPDLWRKAYEKLELLVVVDRFPTADTLYADLVLPSTTFYEDRSYWRYPGGHVRIRERVIEPRGEARGDIFIAAEIARRLGYGEYFPQTEDELLERAFGKKEGLLEELKSNPMGVTLPQPEREHYKYRKGLLRADGKPGFDTPSGKFEITSQMLREFGYEALPVYVEPKEGPLGSPELYARFPLVLNTGARIQSTFRTQHLNIPRLVKMQPQALVLIHPSDAEPRGIKDGDRVIVSSPRGSVPFTARVTDGIMNGCVEANYGGGGPLAPEGWLEAMTNILVDEQNRDPISGFPIYKALLCEVAKAGD
ncbi:MAG: molybdopterin-dependent oxidoreductase [Firmicutes bacterium]|nr:molybdopterin-dependent oxidoreductase [Bacillota bacterium]